MSDNNVTCVTMKNRKTTKKDVRIVVRVEPDIAEWLKGCAGQDDSSVGRIIRKAIYRLKKEIGSASFNLPEPQAAGFAE